MRNYRFRGWSKLQQEWIYGSLITSPKSGEIYIGNSSVSEPVEPGSVGQLTGFWTDDLRNIYEGDILLINDGEEETAYNVLWDEVKAMCLCRSLHADCLLYCRINIPPELNDPWIGRSPRINKRLQL